MAITPDRTSGYPEGIPPTCFLAMEVLAARHRLGEHTWSFPTHFRPTLRRLEVAGLIGFKSGVAEDSLTAWLSDEGKAAALSATYAPPADGSASMTTWKRIDSEEVYGEYGWVTERPVEDAAYSFDPVEYRKQTWRLVVDEVDVIEPTGGYCQYEAGDGPCEDDDVTWQKDSEGHWIALCPKHLADPVERGEAKS